MRKETKLWMDQAKVDLKSAAHASKAKDYYVASFLAQQSAEKALKAVLIEKGMGLVKIHNLVVLAKQTGMPDTILEKCDILSAVYTETRYPDISGKIPSKKFTQSMAKADMSIAKEIIKWCQDRI
ncbi:HEPN domain-containing protein [Candidatus Woesearchaeota archaeon]|nr:HEPN domain-containing protein [Candidatus Woesearchaeota archaeon]